VSTTREQRLADSIRASLGDVPVLLCGSRATGAATATSDYDVLVGLPRRRIPFALGRLRSLDRALTRELGAAVTVNPLPADLLGRPVRNLLVWKVAREGRLLAAPRGFSLPAVSAPPLDASARFSYLLTALLNLLRDLPGEQLPDPLPASVAHGTGKALLHVLQLELMERGGYASTVGPALAELDEARFDRIAAHASEPAGWLEVRDEVLGRLARLEPARSRAGSLAVNARYATLAGLRGRPRFGAALSPRPIDHRLAAVAVELALAVRREGDGRPAPSAALALPRPLRRRAGASWSSIRDVVVEEWSHAHPVLAQ